MKIEWRQCFKIGVSIFILFLCINYWKIVGHTIGVFLSGITPILIGCALAYLVNIFMCALEKKYFPNSKKDFVIKSRRPVCMLTSVLLVIGVVVALIYMIIPELVNCIETFVNSLPDLVKDISKNEYVRKMVSPETLDKLKKMKWDSFIENIGSLLFTGVGGAVNTMAELASSVISIVITVVLGIIFALYFLTGKEMLIHQSKRVLKALFKEKMYHKIMHYFEVFDECFHGYIIGKLIDAVVLGSMCIGVMLICRFPYAVMIGTLIGFSALIPVVGAYVGTAVGALMVLTESPMKALAFLIIILVVQLIEANVIYPKIMGTSIGLPGIWVLAAVTLGGSLFGIVGMLVGVPIFAGFYKIAGESIRRREM
ncbi:AI-2E family transporter [uncultured Eubacterium sp.]|uniref:AI-2E family transporter n=1 Tax=uncultured Eubacterium sp. TaxID=165185 RepID=UPI002670EF22|nr:AI-2E family transporter [uncultured Eubacterium sp.]